MEATYSKIKFEWLKIRVFQTVTFIVNGIETLGGLL